MPVKTNESVYSCIVKKKVHIFAKLFSEIKGQEVVFSSYIFKRFKINTREQAAQITVEKKPNL